MSRTKYPNIAAGLLAQFEDHEVKQRTGQNGRSYDYVTGRTVMNRLDDIVGWENWRDEYHETSDGVLCRITIRLPDGRDVPKEDAGGYPDATGPKGLSEEDQEKAAYSDAFKRCAVKFGVARYLYRDGIPGTLADFVPKDDTEWYPEPTAVAVPGSAVSGNGPLPDPRRPPTREANREQYRDPASPPPSAAPRSASPPRQRSAAGGQGQGQDRSGYGPPRTGKQLYAWAASTQQDMGGRDVIPVVDWVIEYGKKKNWGESTLQWTNEEVNQAFRYGVACVLKVRPDYSGPRPAGAGIEGASAVPAVAPPIDCDEDIPF
jgi:hypothetical protein